MFFKHEFKTASTRRRAQIAFSILMGDSILRPPLKPDGINAVRDEVVRFLTQKKDNL
tara:strand:- start:10263 stop:10433 length:171 start_codon:yes stop_codon:yes gene_type:complete